METKLYTPPPKQFYAASAPLNPEAHTAALSNNKACNLVFWFCYPAINSFALSSPGYLWLLKEAEMLEDVCVEKVTTDTQTTKFMPSDVDLMAFSFSFDLDFLNILGMLEKYNVPLRASERGEEHPLVFAGGPVVSANPEPYRDFFDFVVIGDGERVNIQAVNLIKENRTLPRHEILKLLTQVEGIYVPSLPSTVKKSTKKLEQCIYSTILSDESFFKNTFIIEVERGCANCCRFCLASFLNLPIRFVPIEELKRVIDLGLSYTNKIALLGAQISAHPKFHELCQYIYDKALENLKSSSPAPACLAHASQPATALSNIEMNFSSLRVDAITPDVIKTLVLTGQKHSTLAVEAGSERLRKVINKNITEEQIFSAVKIAKENGLKGLKFYAMIGLPTETQEDIDELISLAKRLKSTFKGFDISFGISTFVPKAHTPFQWCGRESVKSLEKKTAYLTKEFHKLGINVGISSAKWDYWQAVLSRGDGTFTQFLIDAYKLGGKNGAFKQAAKQNNIDADYFAEKTWDVNTPLPWDFIELSAPPKKFLKSEFCSIM